MDDPKDPNDGQRFLDVPLDSRPNMPLKQHSLLKTGTHTNVRTVFLQRLADPTQTHDPQTNPYITVDWMPFDLTVFNGEDSYTAGSTVKEPDWDPDDPSPNSDTNEMINFATRERGLRSSFNAGPNPPPGSNTDYSIWTPVSLDPVTIKKVSTDPTAPVDPVNGEPSGPPDNYFRHKLLHTLGYLNAAYGLPQPNSTPGYQGAPAKPFPWIRWANRPFTSALELMEVPASTPARLCLEFNYVDPSPGPTATNSPYDASPNPNPYMRQFNHLLNFFRATDPPSSPQPGGDFYRIFEYVHVPSPFVGTRTMLDPEVFKYPVPGTETLRVPFNWVSNYRDPGKVNLNTMNSAEVWRAVKGIAPNTGGSPPSEPGATFANLVIARRNGHAPNQFATEPIQIGSNVLPTIIPAPFRAGADMAPDLPGASPMLRQAFQPKGVDATLLRQTKTAGGGVGPPLFANPDMDPSHNSAQLNLAVNSNRNAAFRYRELERLANLTTSRSNVYAIWITVGYFEVFPNPGGVDLGHPDGYQIGAELGSDAGQIERHRGFYIFDRSIPVGFERGFNHNVERALVLKRFIE
jgi:hypothetical protein